MTTRRLQIAFAFVSVLWLSGGTDCTISGTSSPGDSGDDNGRGGSLSVVIGSKGRLIDGPVQGVSWESGSSSGVTGPDGEYEYEEGKGVRFFIGDIALGGATTGKPLLTLLDLIEDGSVDAPGVVNRARLLQSLDSDRSDTFITIPEAVRAAAVHSNPLVAASIDALDFSDEAAFVNAASQLVAALTADYPFTAVLVDAQTAKQHMLDSLQREGIELVDGRRTLPGP